MPKRNVEDGSYRYKYQGQEKDQETGMEAFELRLYDSRINRWLAPDPKRQYHSPYLSMGNKWLSMIDPDGGIVTLADNAATREYIAKIMKSPELKAIYEKLQKSKVHYHINVAESFKRKEYGSEARSMKLGGMNNYSRKNIRVNVLVKKTPNTALNLAALADEIKTAEQFEDFLIGYEPVYDNDSNVVFYDPIDEVETKKASFMALQANGLSAADTDPENVHQSTKVLKAIENGVKDNKALIDILLKTEYGDFFDKSQPYKNESVPEGCPCVNPRDF